MPTEKNHDKKFMHRRTAARTTVFYALFACIWIYSSDTILAWFISEPGLMTKVQTIKGWLFVAATAALLHFYISHSLKKLRYHEEAIDREREAAQRKAKERLDQLSMLFDEMSAVVYVADFATHELLYVNRFAADVFGPDWQQAKCYHYLQGGIEQPCDFCTNAQLIKGDESAPPIVWEFLNTKNKHWYECFDKAIRWSDGRLVRLEIALDITERKELEKTKDDLLSSVSHEMRTPLTAISGFAELLMEEAELPTQFSQQVEIISREAEKLTEIIDRFLDVRRLKTDRARTNYEFLSLRGLLTKAKKQCRDCQPHHDIQIECLSDIQVYGNKQELSQVIAQLLNNACRYSPGGGSISLTAQSTHREVTIRVEDQGIGIPHEELETIFNPFHKLDNGDRRSTKGVGLGLYVAKEIIALHGGQLKVESKLDQGSTFTVLLPLQVSKSMDSLDQPSDARKA
jgi:C4-dicarboxylate-specific signal transduction histidine kinase